MIAVSVALFALGHVIRDGWPDLNTLTGGDPVTGKRGWLGTHAARGFGALACGVGALAAYGVEWVTGALWLAVWIGFYIDQKHAAGQNALTWKDAACLAISGFTSVILASLTLSFSGHLLAADAVIAAGAAKPAIWFLARRYVGEPHLWTRDAAAIFGAAFGAAISV